MSRLDSTSSLLIMSDSCEIPSSSRMNGMNVRRRQRSLSLGDSGDEENLSFATHRDSYSCSPDCKRHCKPSHRANLSVGTTPVRANFCVECTTHDHLCPAKDAANHSTSENMNGGVGARRYGEVNLLLDLFSFPESSLEFGSQVEDELSLLMKFSDCH